MQKLIVQSNVMVKVDKIKRIYFVSLNKFWHLTTFNFVKQEKNFCLAYI